MLQQEVPTYTAESFVRETKGSVDLKYAAGPPHSHWGSEEAAFLIWTKCLFTDGQRQENASFWKLSFPCVDKLTMSEVNSWPEVASCSRTALWNQLTWRATRAVCDKQMSNWYSLNLCRIYMTLLLACQHLKINFMSSVRRNEKLTYQSTGVVVQFMFWTLNKLLLSRGSEEVKTPKQKKYLYSTVKLENYFHSSGKMN